LKDSRQGHFGGDDEEQQNMVHQWLQGKNNFSQAANTSRCSKVEEDYRDGYHAVLKSECAFSVIVVQLCVVK
jgi:hypothetical protein